MEYSFNVDISSWPMAVISVLLSFAVAFISAKFAIYKDLKYIRETRLRDRYWAYLKVLVDESSLPELKKQTYNVSLFAKNSEISNIAKSFLNKKENHQKIEEEEIEQLVLLMRNDLGLNKNVFIRFIAKLCWWKK